MTELNVLALNWRDIKSPEAGGAEVHLHEIMKALVKRGHRVTQLASAFPGCESTVTVDGVEILRRGKWYAANFALPLAYLRELRSRKFDVVVEDINKIPFYMPLYTRAPVLAIVPHLFGTTVFQEASFPFAMYVYSYERLIPAVYRRVRFLAISESTKHDLAARGVGSDRVSVVECGLDHDLYKPLPVQRDEKLIVYLGRLRKYKCVHFVIQAMKSVRERVPGARLVVVGDGPYRKNLEALTAGLGLADAVEFRGHVSQDEKVRLLSEAAVTANPSPKEGWGLTVVEANACGVPVVASRSPGLVDSVRDDRTGFLVKHGSVEQLAARLVEVLVDRQLRERLSAGAIEWAARFSWDTCGALSADVIEEVAAQARR
ncbi:MAG: glycosyltransferase family 4 protein [Candidatus Eisenbacteria bacterium]|nr:glycosyltransferase family 4 protein [Candidatus Eisenbacteria bacterium]